MLNYLQCDEDDQYLEEHQKQVSFNDGRRKIDFVLVFEENWTNSMSSESSLQPPERKFPAEADIHLPGSHQRPRNLRPTNSNGKQNRKMDIRRAFLSNLKLQGLEMEEVSVCL